MAGAGYKLFATGDVLTAAQVNTYLNEQTVMVFADSAARTTALSGVLAEGMMSYLQDTDSVEVYDGSAWTAVGGGGLTSPLTTKGDIWVYGTGDTRLPVGTDGHTLVADSSTATGLAYAAPAGGGKVLQVINATYATQTASSSSTYADTGLTATITPSATNSKILVLVSQTGLLKISSDTNIRLRLLRGATELIEFDRTAGETDDSGWNGVGGSSTCYLDSPNTTSATTYKTQFQSSGNTGSVFVNHGNCVSTITLMEIGA